MFAKISECPPTGTMARLFPAPFTYSTEKTSAGSPILLPWVSHWYLTVFREIGSEPLK